LSLALKVVFFEGCVTTLRNPRRVGENPLKQSIHVNFSYKRYILICCVVLLATLLPNAANASPSKTYFVYARSERSSTSIFWDSMDDHTQVGYLEIPGTSIIHALAPIGGKLAIASADGVIHVVDLSRNDVTQLDANLDMDQDGSTLVDDYQYISSRSWLWSPDGEILAFIGRDESQKSSLYLYLAADRNLNKLPITSPDGLIDVSSWSPDGNWLAVVGSMARSDNQNGVDVWLVSRDGKSSMRLAEDQRVCRLAWAPDGKHLATNTACHEMLGGESSLIILSYDSSSLNRALNSSTFIADTNNTSYEWYGEPVWQDANRLVILKTTGPSGINLRPEEFRTGFVIYNLTSRTEVTLPTPIPKDRDILLQYSWSLWYTHSSKEQTETLEGFNIPANATFRLESPPYLCALRYTKIDPNNEFVALMANCDPSSDQKPDIHIYNLRTHAEVAKITALNNTNLDVFGFTKF
jgi:hypothetical protein